MPDVSQDGVLALAVVAAISASVAYSRRRKARMSDEELARARETGRKLSRGHTIYSSILLALFAAVTVWAAIRTAIDGVYGVTLFFVGMGLIAAGGSYLQWRRSQNLRAK